MASRSKNARAMRLGVCICIGLLGVALAFSPLVLGALTDTRTDWSNFDLSSLTHSGANISDYEGAHDPTNGGTGVQPACIDLASASPDPTSPGMAESAMWSYYDGGTEYDPDDPSTMNDDFIMFRMRVDDDPTHKTGFKQYHWQYYIECG